MLFVSTLGTEYKGGGNISSSLVAAYLREKGIDVVNEYIRKEAPETPLERLLKIIPEGFYNTGAPLLDRLIARRIRQHIRCHRPDILDVQDRFSITAASKIAGGEVVKVFTVIDDLSRRQLESSHRSWKLILLDLKRRSIIRRLRKERFVVANSRHTGKILVEHGISPLNITIIYRSLPMRQWYEDSLEPDESPHGGKGGPVRFLMPGRIAHEKGVREALRCSARLNEEGYAERFELLMIGRGPLAGWARKECSRHSLRNVHILDPVPIHGMLEYYRSSDVVLAPAKCYESFGRVAVEALLLGKPLIIAPRGGVNEIIEDLQNGCILVENEDQLQEAMREVIVNPARLREMRDFLVSNPDTIRKRFNHDRLCADYERYYNNILSLKDKVDGSR